MKVGKDWGSKAEEDVERVRFARETIGPEIELLVDANGAYTIKQAIQQAEKFWECGVTYFEEPVAFDHLDQLAFVRERIPMVLASGEYGYDAYDFRDVLTAGAVDVLQADATRCLGVTGCLQAGELAYSFGIPFSTHTAASLHAHIACAVPQRAELVHKQARGRPVYFTEWNIASNPRHHLHDEPFAAAFATRIVMDVNGFVDGYSYWTFSDIFEENYFPSIPFHGGFGLLTLHGVAKPVYRAFQLLHRLGDELFPVQGEHDTLSVWGARKEFAFTFLVVNQAMPEHPIHTEQVKLTLTNTTKPLSVFVERVDADHANPKKAWMEMGQPEYPNAYELDTLKASSELVKEPLIWTYDQGTIHLQLSMPPQSVAAVTLELGVEGMQNVSSHRLEEETE